MSIGSIWQCLETVLDVTIGGAGATGIWWVEARDMAKHSTLQNAALSSHMHTTNRHPDQNVNCAEVLKDHSALLV